MSEYWTLYVPSLWSSTFPLSGTSFCSIVEQRQHGSHRHRHADALSSSYERIQASSRNGWNRTEPSRAMMTEMSSPPGRRLRNASRARIRNCCDTPAQPTESPTHNQFLRMQHALVCWLPGRTCSAERESGADRARFRTVGWGRVDGERETVAPAHHLALPHDLRHYQRRRRERVSAHRVLRWFDHWEAQCWTNMEDTAVFESCQLLENRGSQWMWG